MNPAHFIQEIAMGKKSINPTSSPCLISDIYSEKIEYYSTVVSRIASIVAPARDGAPTKLNANCQVPEE